MTTNQNPIIKFGYYDASNLESDYPGLPAYMGLPYTWPYTQIEQALAYLKEYVAALNIDGLSCARSDYFNYVKSHSHEMHRAIKEDKIPEHAESGRMAEPVLMLLTANNFELSTINQYGHPYVYIVAVRKQGGFELITYSSAEDISHQWMENHILAVINQEGKE